MRSAVWIGPLIAAQASELRLRQAIAMGRERTIEQDPTFAFRIIVDIALKTLSKAINDPTTAVPAIDQLRRLLRVVGRRQTRLARRASLPAGRVNCGRPGQTNRLPVLSCMCTSSIAMPKHQPPRV
jgi:hypothetical protein